MTDNKVKKIFDFDGFITDEHKEAEPFIEKYYELYQKQTGIDRESLEDVTRSIMSDVALNQRTGWEVGGKIVAPATSSEYVFYTVVFQELYRQALKGKSGTLRKDVISAVLKADHSKLSEMYLEAYKASATVFRHGAKDFLEKNIDACIVTNSSTDKVNEKLRTIGLGDGKIKLFGNAKKYIIGTEIEGIPEFFPHEDLPRKVHLWRNSYNNILDSICNGTPGVTCGDVWELDNALPLMKGYRSITICSENPDESIGMTRYERLIVPNLERSYVVHSLEGADSILEKITRR